MFQGYRKQSSLVTPPAASSRNTAVRGSLLVISGRLAGRGLLGRFWTPAAWPDLSFGALLLRSGRDFQWSIGLCACSGGLLSLIQRPALGVPLRWQSPTFLALLGRPPAALRALLRCWDSKAKSWIYIRVTRWPPGPAWFRCGIAAARHGCAGGSGASVGRMDEIVFGGAPVRRAR